MGGFLILIVILGALWALFVLPSKRRRNQHSAMQDSIEVGDDIITAGGLHGQVTEIDGSTARIEIAPGVVFRGEHLTWRLLGGACIVVVAVAAVVRQEPPSATQLEEGVR